MGQNFNQVGSEQINQSNMVTCPKCGEKSVIGCKFCCSCGLKFELEEKKKCCSHCNALNSNNAKFCCECGASLLPKVCVCGNEIQPGVKFCNECGAKVE